WGPATHWLTGAPPIDRSPEEMFHTPGTHTRSLTLTIVVLVGVATFMPAHAQADDFARWRLDGGLTFSHFEQQIKTEIGGARGDRLVTDSEFGLNLFATFNPIPYLGLGVFTQLDIGTRRAAAFSGVDDQGRTVTSGEVGGR